MALRERVIHANKSAREAQYRLHTILHGDQPTESADVETSKATNTIAFVAESIDDVARSLASVHSMLDELTTRLG